VRHPLASTGERGLSLPVGDTTAITLPTGKTVRLYELRVIPRRATSFGCSPARSGSKGIRSRGARHLPPARAFDLDRDVDSTNEDPEQNDIPAS